MNINDLIHKAKQIACQPTIAIDRHMTVNWAKSLNITVDGPVTIKHGLVIVPINIFSFTTFKDYSKRIVLNCHDLSLKERLPA